MHRRRLLRSAGAAFAAVALATTGRAAELTPDDRARVAEATRYLQALETVSGHFTQIAPDGRRSGGMLYMQRPGKARFDYDPPARMTIVSDGRRVGLWDGRLDTFDTAPLARTPLNLLLAEQVRLDRGVAIGRVDATSEGFALTAQDASRRAQGRIVIYFATAPMALRGWNLIGAQGAMTQVRLGDLVARANLDPALFTLRDPRRRGG